MTGDGRLAELLAGARALLLDFDGPVCSIFAGHSAGDVANELRALLVARGVALTEDTPMGPDPLRLLRWTGRLGLPAVTYAVDDALRTAELRAARTAEPTPGALAVMEAAAGAGKRVAVVSNNSTEAIQAYLGRLGAAHLVARIAGRLYRHPELMKPSAEPVLRVAGSLGLPPGGCLVVGDSPADVESAHAGGAGCVGYANKPGKVERLTEAGADAIVTSMTEIASHLASLAGQVRP